MTVAANIGETVRGQIACPTCATPIALQVGLQVPAQPHGLVWRCELASCRQWIVLSLVPTGNAAAAWELRAFKMTPSQAKIATASPPRTEAEKRGRWILVTFKGGARVAYGPFGSMRKRDVALEAWRRDALVLEAELALQVPPGLERTAVRA